MSSIFFQILSSYNQIKAQPKDDNKKSIMDINTDTLRRSILILSSVQLELSENSVIFHWDSTVAAYISASFT